MLSEDFQFNGFTAAGWVRLLKLLGYRPELAAKHRLVVIENAAGRAVAAFTTSGTIVDARGYTGHGSLAALCARYGCPRGVMVREGVLERVFEDAGQRMPADGDLLDQILPIFVGLRDAMVRGEMYVHPPGPQLPLPTGTMVRRGIDHVLPDGRALVVGVWERHALYTGLVLRKRGGKIDLCAGPDTMARWVGPLGGDYHRDHRAITRAVSRAVAPVHLGVFAPRDQLEALLRAPEPGAWLKAVALREIVFDPAPPYVGAAMAADAARAVADRVRGLLFGVDLLDRVQPLAGAVRDQFGAVSSLTRQLGFNPLATLATHLRASPTASQTDPEDD